MSVSMNIKAEHRIIDSLNTQVMIRYRVVTLRKPLSFIRSIVLILLGKICFASIFANLPNVAMCLELITECTQLLYM